MFYRILLLVFALTGLPTITLAYQLPTRTNDNVVVAAYNIQFLGQRNHDLNRLAQVIQHFDVCGIVEVKNEAELRRLAEALRTQTGQEWGYVYGIRTHRPGGNYHEAYGAVWRKDRVSLGDGVVGGLWDLEEAFRNDPFIVSFKRRNFDFSLILTHTRWSNDAEGTRANEVRMLGEQIIWMRGFLTDQDIILAGDFNYPGTNTHMQGMASAAGLTQIDPNENTTFRQNNSGYANSYDHIYISNATQAEFNGQSSGMVDATNLVYGNNSTVNMSRSKRELSDHLPVWATFNVTLPDDD